MVALPEDTVLPAEPDEAFDRFARLVREQLGVPVALVSLVSSREQVFPGAVGLPEPWQQRRGTPLSHSFCQFVVDTAEPLVVTDARHDPRVAGNLAIRDLGVVAYCGVPLTGLDDRVVGSLCAIDDRPRQWTAADLAVLTDLAAACSSELRLREREQRARRRTAEAEAANAQLALLLELSEVLASAVTVEDVAAAVAGAAGSAFGASHAYVGLVDQPHGRLRFVVPPGSPGRPGETAPLDDDHPAARAARTGGQQVEDAAVHLPLVAGVRVLGTVSVGWDAPHALEDDDRLTLQALARYAAQALGRAELLAERRTTAEVLQRAMLTELPAVPGLELAAAYVPSSARDRVGGDWYDTFAAADGATVLAIGDVTGHDVQAAATMGQLRTMLRTLAHDRPEEPSRTITRLDRAVTGLAVGSLATLLLARLVPAAGGALLTWSNAGHPAPLLRSPDGAVEVLTGVAVDRLVGLDLPGLPPRERTDVQRLLPAGATLLLFTDGLVERRGEDLDAGTGRLAAAFAACPDLPLAELLPALLAELGSDGDDVAVLAARVSQL